MTVPAESVLSSWPDDPVLFATDVLADPLRPAQKEVLYALAHPDARRVALRAPRGWGKTVVEIVAAMWWCATRPDSLTLIACPSERQVLNFFEEFQRVFRVSRLPHLFPNWVPLNSQLLTGRAGWGIRGLSSDSPALLEGAHADRLFLVVDEAKALPDSHFTALVGSCASSSEWKVLAVGTGGAPVGWWYRAHGAERSLWETFTHRADDESSAHLREVIDAEAARLGRDDPQFRSLYESEFTDSRAWSMFAIDAIERAIGADPDADDPQNHPLYPTRLRRVIGADLARVRDDTVLAYLSGRSVTRFEILPHADEMTTAGLIVARARAFRCHALGFDEAGLGHGILSRAQEVLREDPSDWAQQVDIVGLNSAWRADDADRFANLKAEILVRLRTMLLDGQVGLPREGSERLISEMLGVRLELASSGKLKTVDPTPSPDFLDALVVALHARDGNTHETTFAYLPWV